MQNENRLTSTMSLTFNTMYTSYNRYVMKILRNFCSNNSIEDVSQDAFIEIYRSMNGIRMPHRVKYWISKITVRVAMRHVNRPAKRRELTKFEECEKIMPAIDPKPQPDSVTIVKDQIDALKSELSEEELDLVNKAYVEGYTSRELGEEFGITSSAVRSKLSTLRKRCLEIESTTEADNNAL